MGRGCEEMGPQAVIVPAQSMIAGTTQPASFGAAQPGSAGPARDSRRDVDSTRRAFLGRAGAVLCGPVAIAAAGAAGLARTDARARAAEAERGASGMAILEARLANLEDRNAIRELHQRYVRHLNEHAFGEGAYGRLLDLFTDDATVQVESHARWVEDGSHRDVIVVAPDRHSAAARFHGLVEVEAPLPAVSPLIEMARQQGQGVARWWERGVHEAEFARIGGRWRIAQLRYRALERVDRAAHVV